VVWIRGDIEGRRNTSHVRRLDTRTGAVADFNILGRNPTSSNWDVCMIATDPNDADVVYARTTARETGEVFFMTTDGGRTWRDISAGLPTATNGRGFMVQPTTGLLLIGTTQGLFLRKPPYPVPTGTSNLFDFIRSQRPYWPTVNHMEAYP
jgi:hypothetical protein